MSEGTIFSENIKHSFSLLPTNESRRPSRVFPMKYESMSTERLRERYGTFLLRHSSLLKYRPVSGMQGKTPSFECATSKVPRAWKGIRKTKKKTKVFGFEKLLKKFEDKYFLNICTIFPKYSAMNNFWGVISLVAWPSSPTSRPVFSAGWRRIRWGQRQWLGPRGERQR